MDFSIYLIFLLNYWVLMLFLNSANSISCSVVFTQQHAIFCSIQIVCSDKRHLNMLNLTQMKSFLIQIKPVKRDIQDDARRNSQ